MFNVCRRGAAPLTRRIAASSISRSAVCKQSILSLSARNLTQRSTIPFRSFHSSPLQFQYDAAAAQSVAAGEEGELITKFPDLADRGLVHQNVINSIVKGMGYENMTRVQSMTINECLRGTDVIAQAKTGTGKTLGFLIPTIQNILNKSPELATPSRKLERNTSASDIRAIIMSPTRELAEQIAVEAEKVCRGTALKVQVAVGGTQKRAMQVKTMREGCHILVATPGRLNDLLSDPYSKIRAPDLDILILDEADRMLDMGFSQELGEIQQKLPDRRVRDRQTLMFSATVPSEIMGLVRKTLKPNFQFVQTVQKGEVETHQKVPQTLIPVNGMENIFPTIVEIAKREVQNPEAKPFKAILYYNATGMVDLAFEQLMNLKGDARRSGRPHPLNSVPVFRINAKMTQMARTRSAEDFRRAKTGILISTDVTARGMDFPNVSHVIQAGLPSARDQYIHRIGRTGRGDKQGEAYILTIKGQETSSASKLLHGLPLQRSNHLDDIAMVDMTQDAQVPENIAETLREVSDASLRVDEEMKQTAYLAALGVFSGFGLHKYMRITNYVDSLNNLAVYGWGLPQAPPIPRGLALKMGIQNAPGLNLGPMGSGEPRVRGFGGRGGGDFGGRGGGGFGGRGGGFGRGDRDGGFGGRSGRYGDRDGGFSRGGGFGRGDRDGGRSGGYGRGGDRDGGRDGGFSRGGGGYGRDREGGSRRSFDF